MTQANKSQNGAMTSASQAYSSGMASRKQLQDDNRKLAKDLGDLKKQLTAAFEAQAAQTQPLIVESGEEQDRSYDFARFDR